MEDALKLTIRGKLAIINGKTYSLLRLYREDRLGGTFCLIAAGRTPLKSEDLTEHWRVIHTGDVYLALDARPFSYHLMQGEGRPTDAPRWPRLTSPATYYAFVGPTEDAVHTLIRLTLERYRSRANPEQAITTALRVHDECGGPPAYLLRSSNL